MGYVVLSVFAASGCAGVALANGASARDVIATYILTGVVFLLLAMILESYNE